MTFSHPIEPNLSTRLLQALMPDEGALLRLIAEEAAARSLPLYIVGGFVRDLLLGQPGLDFDLVVEGNAISFARFLTGKYGGKVASHAHFGTAVWTLNGSTFASSHGFSRQPGSLPSASLQTLDLISARSETYEHPAALPTVRRSNLSDDLRRRDFTINTLALRLDGEHFGELRDELGGVKDLQTGLLRVLHPASFEDDPTRLFRLVRYEQRYTFQITPETLALIPGARPLIPLLSAERLRHELDLILAEGNAAYILNRLGELELLAAAHPDLQWTQAAQARFEAGMAAAQTLECPPSRIALGWAFWLMDVPRVALKGIEKRLHFESGLRELLLAASVLFEQVDSLAGKSPSQIAAFLDKIPLDAVQAVSLALPSCPARQELRAYLATWRHIKPRTTGDDLITRGLPAGPRYRKILTLIRNAWLDGEITTEAEEMAYLEKLIEP